MIRLPWSQTRGARESLAGSVCALLAGFGRNRSYDEVVSVLGLGSATVAVADECPRVWSTYARDAALTQSAELLGLRLRDLHPPAAATNLSHSAEFPQHFQDSYVPLIQRAIAVDQPVLAWCGWPAPAERAWGVICDLHGEALRGYAVGAGDELVPLVGPVYQVYVVEEYRTPSPARSSATALLMHAAGIACAQWCGQLPVPANIAVGERAYTRWREAALRPPPCPHCGITHRRCHVELAQSLAAARQSLATWLQSLHRDLAPALNAMADHWAEVCHRVAAQLNTLNEHDSGEVWRLAIESAQKTEAASVARLEIALREHG